MCDHKLVGEALFATDYGDGGLNQDSVSQNYFHFAALISHRLESNTVSYLGLVVAPVSRTVDLVVAQAKALQSFVGLSLSVLLVIVNPFVNGHLL